MPASFEPLQNIAEAALPPIKPLSPAPPSHRHLKQITPEKDPAALNSTNPFPPMDVRMFGFENPLLSTLHHLVGDIPDEAEKSRATPTGTYVRDARAMASTPADVKELPTAYTFVVDMPGVSSGEIKVQIEDDNVLVISGERRRGEEEQGEGEEGRYLRMERRMGKFMRKFSLPENADLDRVTAECRDGVLTVTVMKKPPPEPKKPRTVQVRVA